MDATCKVQDNIHVFRLIHNMCPGFWVHITNGGLSVYSAFVRSKANLKSVFASRWWGSPLDIAKLSPALSV